MFAVLFSAGMLHAKPKSKLPQHVNIDSSPIVLHQPSAKKQSDYQEDKFWKYGLDEKRQKLEPGFFDRLWANLINSILHSGREGGVNWWYILFILLLVGLIVLFVLRATNSGANTLFRGKISETENIDATAEDVNIHTINYEQQIADAIRRKDYRLGVRLWFLRTLKQLSDKELLNWKIDKTNSDYYYELSGSNFQEDFGKMSFVYDYAWYGEFPLDESSYHKAEEQFRNFYSKITH